MALKRPLLMSLLTCSFLLVNVQSQGDTTSFTYDSFRYPVTDNLTYQGHVFVPLNNTTLSLASLFGTLTYNTVGRVMYSSPIQFWDSGREASFETTIRFTISSPDPNPGDGIAFFIAPVSSTIPPGSEGANLGIFNQNGQNPSVFAVEFDIYPNAGWDPLYRHIGIDIASRNSVKVTRCDGVLEVTARINYESTTRNISVHAKVGGQVYSVSYIYDLKNILPQQVPVDRNLRRHRRSGGVPYDIYSWYFTSTLDSHPPQQYPPTYSSNCI